MPVYPRPRNDSRALARELADLRRRGEAAVRRPKVTAASNVPPPVDVQPAVGSLVEWLLEHENREPQ